MTDTQRAAIHRLLEQQEAVARESPEAARESLMRTGFYNEDGTLKQAYGGDKKPEDK